NEDGSNETTQSSQESSFEYRNEFKIFSKQSNVKFEGTHKEILNYSLGEEIKKSEFICYNFSEFSNFKKIGEGGYCQVKKAYCKSRSKMIALKSLKSKMISNKCVCEEFIREF
ncbi:22589_t:CDS:2, partial [Dentiscutata erythropus]